MRGCIFDVFLGAGELHIFLLHHLDPNFHSLLLKAVFFIVEEKNVLI